MKPPKQLRRWATWARALILPMGGVNRHLCVLAGRTAEELGAQPEVIRRLEALTRETCQEAGFIAEKSSQGHCGVV